MDPVTAITGIKAATTVKSLAQGAPSMTRKAFRAVRLSGTFEPRWIDLAAGEADNPQHELTSAQLDDVHKFLASSHARPLLALLTLVQLSPSGPDRDAAMSTVKRTFEIAATRWNADSQHAWRKQTGAIWSRIEAIYEDLFSRMIAAQPELAEEIEEFSYFLVSPLQLKRTANGSKTYLSRLMELATSLDTLVAVAERAAELATAIHSTELESIITHSHAELEHNADFLQLYVARQFTNLDTAELIDAEELAVNGQFFRLVLKGSPGAGKTTFVSHLIYRASDPAQTMNPLGTILVRCRDYVSKYWDMPVTEFMARNVTAETSHRFSEDELCSVLLLGKAIVVFDGLDEVTDRGRRADMVKRIHSFTARFPAVSVLVTTREVGYDHAPLSRSVFQQVRLSEFDEDQVIDYATKWFTLAGKPDRVTPFLIESESIEDLRKNPLLLSLLCILYRDSGAIPADRRGIYSKCAELLFKKWDTHRQISQSGAMPSFADRLMQEIARWFYSTPSTQAGLEEQQISRVLAQYMVQALGFEETEAERNANEFMDFCAGRAWLLGSIGPNEYGRRLFRFTHRTFYEYFTAESLSRQSNSAEEVSDHVIEAWSRDSTSVVPELVVQSYDFSHERGAARVFQQLCSRRASSLLLLRLMQGTILPNYARQTGFSLIADRWIDETNWRNQIAPEEYLTLLSISPQARTQFISEYLLREKGSRIGTAFLECWASLEMNGGSGPYRHTWSPVVAELAKERDMIYAARADQTGSLLNWAIGNGHNIPLDDDGLAYLLCGGTFGPSPGVVWWSIESLFGRGEQIPNQPARLEAIRRSHQYLSSTKGLSSDFVDQLNSTLLEQRQNHVEWQKTDIEATEEKELREILAILLCAMAENDSESWSFVELFDDLWDQPLSRIVSLRSGGKESLKSLSPDETASVRTFLRTQPLCIREWAVGRRSLLQYS
jgi:hypothetical protein